MSGLFLECNRVVIMWCFIYILILETIVISSEVPVCEDERCALIFSGATPPINNYKLGGKDISLKVISNHLHLNCNGNDIDLETLPKFSTTVYYDKIYMDNCTFSASEIVEVFNKIKITSQYLVLNSWQPSNVGIFVKFDISGLEINNGSYIHKDLVKNLIKLSEFKLVNTDLHVELTFPSSLGILRLANNKMKVLPDLKNVTLEKLAVTQNGIKYFPPMVLHGDSLKVLDFSYNNLTDISSELLLDNVQELYLQGNLISNLKSSTFDHFSQLRILNMSFNHIKILPKEIFNRLSQLHTIDLSHNDITSIEAYVFPGTSGSLHTLNLAYNNITYESLCPNGRSRLGVLEKLAVLHLEHNSLYDLCLLYLPSLVMLDVSYNRIWGVSTKDFKYQNPNITVNYGHNQINIIHIEMDEYTNPVNLKNRKFIMESNPIQCNYGILFFIRKARESNLYNNILDAKCEEPARLKNRYLSSLTEDDLDKTFSCDIIDTRLGRCQCFFGDNLVVNCSNQNNVIDVLLTTNLTMFKFYSLICENCSLSDISKLGDITFIELHLAHNYISRVPKTLTVLQYLDLSDNNITRLSIGETARLLSFTKGVKLSHNMIPCDCDNIYLVTGIIHFSEKVVEPELLVCDSGEPLYVPVYCEIRAKLIVVVALAVLAIVIYAISLYFKYRLPINAFLYSRGWCLRFLYVEDLEKDKKYDAFVSYAHGDQEFISKELLPRLEGQWGYKLCVHHRDWLIGPDIPSQILTSVEDSRRTIVVLSENFLNSVWAKAEFRAANEETIRTGLPRVLVVVLSDTMHFDSIDSELKNYLCSNSYIFRSDPLFWQKLCFAMPHKRYKRVDVMPLSRTDEKKRQKRVKMLANYVEREFTKRKNDALNT